VRKGFKLEGTTRSPWYDNECDRAGATPQNIAQELDRDYGGSSFRVFSSAFLEAAKANTRPPFFEGNFTYHQINLDPDFDKVENGQSKLWTTLNLQSIPPQSAYVVGVDVSTGTGGSYTSNSCAVVFDMVAMEQVFEFVSNTTLPTDFADMCIALSKWFHDAYLIWEQNGPGGAPFTKRVLDQRYANIFWRKTLWKRSRGRPREAGWWTDTKSEPLMFEAFSMAVRTGELKVRSDALVSECTQYIWKGGKITHMARSSTPDESSKGSAHGDRVIAACVAFQGIKDRPINTARNATPQGVYGSQTVAGRLKQHQDSLNTSADPWDDRTNFDLMQDFAI
jgi:hypothetical protein